ncbi:translocation/assembly module TamB domain-containing protein [Formosa sp. A9]|uniref:translocation/assembly module TamB domain-containing protein n=1 Tax=Formosa sp. A9 TaxID=3442641 RepID=UPI003EBC6360
MKTTKPDINTAPKKRKILKILKWLVMVLLFIFFTLVLIIRSSWGQNTIIGYITSFVSEKTHTKIEIGKVFLTFSGDLKVEDLFLEDTKGDTLIYSKTLKADVPLLPIIRGKGVGIESLTWDGFRANIIRNDSISGYNFQFLIDAFASESDTPEPPADPNAEPLSIIIKDIALSHFNIVFYDAVLGIDSHFKLGEIYLDMDTFDLNEMNFRVSEARIEDSEISYIQHPVPAQPQDTTSTTLPVIAIDEFAITNVKAHYETTADQLTLDANIATFETEIPNIDLANNTYAVDDIALKNSSIIVNTRTATTQTTEQPDTTTGACFTWPQLSAELKHIDLQNNTFGYYVNDQKPQKNVFNGNALSITAFTLKAQNIYLKNEEINAELNQFEFREASGLALNKANFNLNITDQILDLNHLEIIANQTILQGQTTLNYPSIASFLKQPEQSKIALELSKLQLDITEAYRFQPELQNNAYVDSLSQRFITGQLYAKGTLSEIQLDKAQLNWGKTTQIAVNGQIKNPTITDSLYLNLPTIKAEITKQDLLKFVNETELGLSLPETVVLTGQLNGQLNNINTDLALNTSLGNATLKADYKDLNGIAFDTELDIDGFKLNTLLNNEQLGPLSLTVKATGTGNSVNDLDAILDAKISSLKLQNYQITDLLISGELNKGAGDIVSKYKDDNINLKLNSHVVLDSVSPEANIDLDLIGANLQALGLVQKDIRAGLNLHLDFKGNGDQFDASTNIKEGVIVYDNKTYLLGDILAEAHVRPDTTYLSIDNKLLSLNLESNTNPNRFSAALQNHIQSYFYRDSTLPDSLKPVIIKLEGKLAQGPILNDVFLPNLKAIDTVNLAVDFNQKEKVLKTNITAPHINYNDYELDSLQLNIDTDVDDFNFDLGFKHVAAGPISLKRTSFSGKQYNHEMAVKFIAFDEDDVLTQWQANIAGHRDSLHLKVVPDSLMINRELWNIPNSNQITYTPNALHFKDFTISKNQESIAITNGITTNNKDEITIAFNQFGLNDLLAYFNPDNALAQGNLNGDFTVQNPFGNSGFLADLSIDNLKVLNANLGTLTLQGNSNTNNTYTFALGTKDGDVDLDFNGNYQASNTQPNLNANLVINDFKMKAVEGLSLNELSNASGSLSGDFKITGSLAEPKYTGQLNFNNADVTVTKLNTNFIFTKETLNIDNSGISLSNFTIKDNNESAFVFNGKITTEDLANPKFNLDLEAKDFQVLNATKEDNDMMYGQLSFDAKGQITGDLTIPKIDLTATVSPTTDLSYVMPSSTVNIEERDGVVVFVNRQNPNAILTKTQEKTATVTGFDLNASFTIPKEAVFTLILDESTGDNFQTSGDGDFVFRMDPNGRMNLSGVYTVSGGHYEMSLYQLVRRKFELVPGSRVSWSGNPLDANMDVKALYNVKTSSLPLMASQISGSDPAVKNKYKQVLPFEVYLNIDGELMQPKISFKLDMPEDEQGAISGQVYGRVQQVNQQEGELNRQVFSLLVMNRFYPESGSDGSSGGFASIARDNLNDAISDQLNMFSDKLLGSTGLELDFGLNSFTDYQGSSPEQRTQLDVAAQKKLFNERVIVRVGSAVDIEGSDPTGEEAPLIGDVSLEYLITPSGKYRLKAFQKNEFESVIDGQTIVSGLALIFTQEFNKFRDLWDAMLHSKEERQLDKQQKEEEKLKTKTAP